MKLRVTFTKRVLPCFWVGCWVFVQELVSSLEWVLRVWGMAGQRSRLERRPGRCPEPVPLEGRQLSHSASSLAHPNAGAHFPTWSQALEPSPGRGNKRQGCIICIISSLPTEVLLEFRNLSLAFINTLNYWGLEQIFKSKILEVSLVVYTESHQGINPVTMAFYFIWLHVSVEITSTHQGNLRSYSHFTDFNAIHYHCVGLTKHGISLV